MSVLSIILLCVVGLIVLFLLICVIDAAIAFYSPIIMQNKIDVGPALPHADSLLKKLIDKALEVDKIEYEDCFTESVDKLKLHARFYKGKEDKPYVILMHGYRGLGVRDFAFVIPMLINEGYNVLLVDQRGCSESQGHATTFGIRERQDARRWIYYLLNKFGKNISIVLYGISMGGATVLMTADLSLPRSVKCIVSDCPYTTPKDIIKKVCKTSKLPSTISFFFLRIAAYLLLKLDIESSSALEAVKHTDIPILLLHGESDDFVPCEMSRIIEDNCFGPVERYTFPDAEHAFASVKDPERYEKLVIEFIEKNK